MIDPRLIEACVRNYNNERKRLCGECGRSVLAAAKRDRIEGERHAALVS
jgi:hypothetical protein